MWPDSCIISHYIFSFEWRYNQGWFYVVSKWCLLNVEINAAYHNHWQAPGDRRRLYIRAWGIRKPLMWWQSVLRMGWRFMVWGALQKLGGVLRKRDIVIEMCFFCIASLEHHMFGHIYLSCGFHNQRNNVGSEWPSSHVEIVNGRIWNGFCPIMGGWIDISML